MTGLSSLGVAPLQAARFLNAGLFGATIALEVEIARRYGRHPWTPPVAAALLVTSWPFLEQYSRVMSEALALFLGFTGLLFVARYLEEAGPLLLLVGGVVIGLALATRYSCLPFLMTAELALLTDRRRGHKERIANAVVFGALAAAPQALWLAHNVATTGTLFNRAIAFHPPGWGSALVAVRELSTFLLPPRVPDLVRFAFLTGVVAGVGSLVAFNRRRGPPVLANPLAGMLRRFIVIDLLFLVGVMTFADAAVTPGRRHLLAAYLAGLLLIALLFDTPLAAPARAVRRPLSAALAAFLAIGASVVGAKCLQLARNGSGYWSRESADSVLQRLGFAPYCNRTVYSDDPQQVLYLTGREARRLPSRFDPITRRPNGRYAEEIEAIQGEIRDEGALIVEFAGTSFGRYPTVEELEGAGRVPTIGRDAIVTILGREPRPREARETVALRRPGSPAPWTSADRPLP